MDCLIINGNPEPSDFDSYLDEYAREMEKRGHGVTGVNVRDKNIKYCVGCWTCWYKTPGLCVFDDDMASIYPLMAGADLVIWASPLILGNISALLKKTQDRFVPLAHPYIEIVDGECHHRHRYAKNPDIALIFEPTGEDSAQDIAIVRRLFARFSLNTRTKLALFCSTETPVEEAVNETLTA